MIALMRLLFFLLVVFILYQVIRLKWLAPPAAPKSETGEPLVKCIRCGTWVPTDSALLQGSKEPLCHECAAS